MKRLEEKILLFCCLLLIAFFLAWMLAGCQARSSVSNIKFTKGCHIEIDGIASDTFPNLEKVVDIEDCKITTESDRERNPE